MGRRGDAHIPICHRPIPVQARTSLSSVSPPRICRGRSSWIRTDGRGQVSACA
ncbi:hypothetical protein TMO_a0335 (plasmid) [Tistrella mobilis KA081020-065]|uniref:Uncharacterized protein n=1 Tax=Tistrella mobilis (strain KA081020-065) TaxID=1110502 RepID=I3TSK0_TISMK|nr:hypothetical protein TMO_a0335 [Tistrella mobilis KA081020-065]